MAWPYRLRNARERRDKTKAKRHSLDFGFLRDRFAVNDFFTAKQFPRELYRSPSQSRVTNASGTGVHNTQPG